MNDQDTLLEKNISKKLYQDYQSKLIFLMNSSLTHTSMRYFPMKFQVLKKLELLYEYDSCKNKINNPIF